MVRYADTCLLLSLFFRDSGTDAALDWLERAGTEPIAISHWTHTEFASAAGIMTRRGDLSPALHAEGLARFDAFATARLITDRRQWGQTPLIAAECERQTRMAPEVAGVYPGLF